MSMVMRLLLVLFALFLSTPVLAMDPKAGCGGECASCHSLSQKEAATLLKDLGTVKAVKEAQVRGLWEVTVERDGKSGVVYVDYGKSRLIAGQIFDIATLKPVATAVEGPRVRTAERIDPGMLKTEHSLVMGNPKGKKRLFVFTDPQCPYCAKLHAELKKLVKMEPDLAIYIKMFPLKIHPHAYDYARVIMGTGSIELLEKSLAGGKLPAPGAKDGKKAVDESMNFAHSVGINSTPTLILPDGKVEVGFMEAPEIKKLLAPAGR